MPALFPGFLLDIAEPIARAEKFLWAELPGDTLQIFGKSLDMHARIQEAAKNRFELTLITRDGSETTLPGLRSLTAAKKRAEDEYSQWIQKSALIEHKPGKQKFA